MSHRNIDKPWAPSDEKLGLMLAKALVGEASNASLDRIASIRRLIKLSLPLNLARRSVPLEFIPTVDGEVLPDEVSLIFSRGEQTDVPTMIGNNANEHAAVMDLFACINGRWD